MVWVRVAPDTRFQPRADTAGGQGLPMAISDLAMSGANPDPNQAWLYCYYIVVYSIE